MNKKVFFRYLAMATLFFMVAIVSSCKKELCSVTFISDDNIVFQFEVLKGSKLSAPVIQPNQYYDKEHIFGGWFTDREFNNIWNFATNLVEKNITLYAKWVKKDVMFTVTFIDDGNVFDTISVVYGSKLPDSYMNITKEGYTFFGWFTDINFYYIWDFTNGIVTEDVKLYSRWKWGMRKVDFIGDGRYGAVGFSIGNKGYIGTGFCDSYYCVQDFWEYDPAANRWTQKANFAGGDREYAVGFSIANKGYIGTGSNRTTGNAYCDFWEYDPVSNTWTKKADFEGGYRYCAVGFSIDNKGYIGTGEGSSDFWEYDPATNKWTQKANFAGVNRWGAVGFSIENKGYIGSGYNGNYLNDFWEYDPVSNTWTKKTNFAGENRIWAVGFSIGNKGYIGPGNNDYYVDDLSYFWEYDPVSNSWTKKADFAGGFRYYAVGFSIGNKGYIGTGNNWSAYVNDFWELIP